MLIIATTGVSAYYTNDLASSTRSTLDDYPTRYGMRIFSGSLPDEGMNKPLVGDWNGNGYDMIDVFRPSTAQFFLDYANDGVSGMNTTFGTACNTQKSEFVQGELIVKFKPSSDISLSDSATTVDCTSIDVLNRKYGVSSVEKVFKTTEKHIPINTLHAKRIHDLSNICKLKVPKEADILSIVEQYQINPNVEYAEPNYIV
jgi:hypothetical protein